MDRSAAPPYSGRMAIRVGIGGWDYDPWRGTFYPPGLPKARQLHFASRQVTAIEINATFYKLQSPDLFERWAADTPDDFVFAIKGGRACTNRKVLAEAGEAIARFCGQGLTRLGAKLGPILWQLADTKKLELDDVSAFLRLLPREQDGVALRHVVEARNPSFRTPAFLEAARAAGVAVCHSDTGGQEAPTEPTAGFAYARLLRAREAEPAGYSPAELDDRVRTARGWAQGGRDVFLFVINGDKVRAPAAATALLERLRSDPVHPIS